MTLVRMLCAALLPAILVACAETPASLPPALSIEQQQSYRVAQVSVTVPDTAQIRWDEGDQAATAARGIAPGDIGAAKAYLASPAGQVALREAVRQRFQLMADRLLINALRGGSPAHLSIRISEVDIASHAQILAISGNHSISGAVQLFDLETGTPLTAPQFMRGDAEGGIGFVGVIVDATRRDALGRATTDFMRNALEWLGATGPVEMDWPTPATTPVPPLDAPFPARS